MIVNLYITMYTNKPLIGIVYLVNLRYTGVNHNFQHTHLAPSWILQNAQEMYFIVISINIIFIMMSP